MVKLLQIRISDALYDTIKELSEVENSNMSETTRILIAAGLNQFTDRHVVRAQVDDQIQELQSKLGELASFRETLEPSKPSKP